MLGSGDQPIARVRVGRGYLGHLLCRSSVECSLANAQRAQNEVPGGGEIDNAWARTSAILFSPPPCAPDLAPGNNSGPAKLSAWRLIVGWQGASVGVLDYHTTPSAFDGESSPTTALGSPRGVLKRLIYMIDR
jgi:hypothetical protein